MRCRRQLRTGALLISRGCAGGSRFDPPHDVWVAQQALWLKEAGRLLLERDVRPDRRPPRGKAQFRIVVLPRTSQVDPPVYWERLGRAPWTVPTVSRGPTSLLT